jgi:hypothetical protein
MYWKQGTIGSTDEDNDEVVDDDDDEGKNAIIILGTLNSLTMIDRLIVVLCGEIWGRETRLPHTICLSEKRLVRLSRFPFYFP